MITRSPQNLAENLVAALKGLEWAQVGVVMCEECYEDDEMASEKYFSTVQDILADNNIAIKETLKLKKGGSSQNISQEISVFESSARGKSIGELQIAFYELQFFYYFLGTI